jgi:2-haloalkanoic acid dehalogenase type II
MTLDYDAFDALTFDCYGTLIDWEAGILAGLRPILERGGATADDEAILERYAAIEALLEAGPYLPYRAVLARGARKVAAAFGVEPTDEEAAAFGGSVADWPAFEDSSRSLRRLKHRFRLGVLTNCDDDLFAASKKRLGVDFDWVVTAQQVGSYKPSHRNFDALLERLAQDRVTPRHVIHVAQSLYHDHVPAKKAGLRTVWIDRRHDLPGAGATPPAEAHPDATFPSMAAFADAALGEG